MRQPYANALLCAALSGCLLNAAPAQSKKTAVPAAAVPTKTAKLLANRLASVARAEESKTKKNSKTAAARLPLKLKEAAKPVPNKAVAKTTLMASKSPAAKQATLKNAERPTGKTTKVALTAKADPVKAVAKAQTLTTRKTNGKALKASALALQQKGKFGRDNRPASEDVTPTRDETPRNERQHPNERETARNVATPEPAPRRVRPRVVEEPVKEAPATTLRNNELRNAEPDRIPDAPKMPLASPDRIEVHEPGSPVIVQMHQLPNTRPSAPYGTVVTRGNTPPAPRKDITMTQQRVFEIQYELAKRGFYTAEPNGLYDDVTVAAMWEFQKNYGLPATGYPTAHALKRLSLTSW
jgi:hypothetical protein